MYTLISHWKYITFCIQLVIRSKLVFCWDNATWCAFNQLYPSQKSKYWPYVVQDKAYCTGSPYQLPQLSRNNTSIGSSQMSTCQKRATPIPTIPTLFPTPLSSTNHAAAMHCPCSLHALLRHTLGLNAHVRDECHHQTPKACEAAQGGVGSGMLAVCN